MPGVLVPAQEADGFNLGEAWRAVRRRRRLVLVVGAGVLAISLGSTLLKRITAPVYEGSFQLLITDPINSAGGGAGGSAAEGALGGGVVESLARNRTSVDIPTLIQALSSPLAMDPVRRALGESGAILNSLAITQAGDRRQGGAVQGVLQISLQGREPQAVQRSLTAVSKAYLAFTLAQRQERVSEGLRFLDKQEPLLEAKVDELQGQLARFRRQHNLLTPETEATALKLESASMEVQGRQVLAERARLLKLRQDIAAGRLTAANFSSGGGSSGGSAPAASASGGSGGDGVSVTQAKSDQLDQLQSVEQQLAQARAVYRSDSPRIRNLVELRNRLTSQLRSEQLRAVDTALSLNATRSTVLNSQRGALDRQFLQQPALIKDYEELQQRLKVAQGNLANFLATRSTFQLEQAQNTVPWKVIAPPSVMGYPVEPSLKRGLLQGLLLAAAAGIGAGLLRDRLDHVFHSPAEVKEELQEPLLGHIPHVPFFKGVREDNRFLIEELDRTTTGSNKADEGLSGYQRFFYQEAFRNLFTSLRFLNSGQPLRSLALTSSLPAEGKSLVNVLLAKTLSEMGQRVLLVDADLRKPQMHHRLGVNNLTGLSNLLTENDLHWRDVIQPVAGYEGWNVLTAGRRPPDPARLLSSMRMHDLVRELADSGQFDLILYDTPPVLGLADAALVAEHLDGLMLLVSLDRVDRSLPKEAAARIRSAGASLLGVVTNAVKEETASNSTYGYGYGKYGYGYGGYGGYGYGAYDPRSTYAYYQPEAQDAPVSSSAQANQTRERFRTAQRKLMRWIDS
jgi:succinoglycan biosynthesis transport protein ExoP